MLKSIGLLFMLTVSVNTMNIAFANPITELKKVGSAKLEVFFFDIYISTLYSSDGKYDADSLPIALHIKYLRDIKSKDLIARTEQEWQKLGYSDDKITIWLDELSRIWPDIKKHDELTFTVDAQGQSQFLFNDSSIGSVQDDEFANSFLAIWLSEKSSYPKLQKKLIGEQS